MPRSAVSEWGSASTGRQSRFELIAVPADNSAHRSEDAGDSCRTWQGRRQIFDSRWNGSQRCKYRYLIPIESDEFRCTPEAKLRVYRTKDGGESWQPLTNGLPQADAFETILRDNLKADQNNPTGLYFGTRNGKLFGSADGGDSWKMIREGLPPITCVKTATIN
jgi:hypothetical protein